jgi:hypothetical protein
MPQHNSILSKRQDFCVTAGTPRDWYQRLVPRDWYHCAVVRSRRASPIGLKLA